MAEQEGGERISAEEQIALARRTLHAEGEASAEGQLAFDELDD